MPAKRVSDRSFGLVFAALFLVIALLGWLLAGRLLVWALAVSASFALLAALAPGLLLPLNRLWTLLGQRIGFVMNHVLLGLFFYLVILPVGLVLRASGSRMVVRPDAEADSYWSDVGRKAPDSYADQF
jgi:hypothetical protein